MNQLMKVILMRRDHGSPQQQEKLQHLSPTHIVVSRDNFQLMKNSSMVDTQAFQNSVVKGYMQNDLGQYRA